MLCTMIDWKQAYSRQSHILGVKLFLDNGVRPSLIPLLTSYFQSREIRIKWHGQLSQPRRMPGSGAMGSSLGNWEFDSQTNHNADSVPAEDRFKFVDNLTVLEVINLISIGIISYDILQQVPNDIQTHNQFVDNKKLLTQTYLDQINLWTENQQMILSENKTKSMILNFTKNFQFTTRLQLKQKNVEIVDKIKILGTLVNNQLSWNENCSNLIKKANARMQLLRKVWSFGSTRTKMFGLWKVFCRSILEQTCPVWSSSLTDQNKSDLERVQKTFVKLILEEDYTNFKSGLSLLH